MRPTAPIVLFVYRRLDHTKRTIEALRNNILAEDSDLFIYSDAAKGEHDLTEVELLRTYLRSITGFRNVHICLRSHNLGVDENIVLGVTEVINDRGRVIVLEDDLVTSSWFLTFMNDALDVYKDNEEVVSIHGYLYPLKKKLDASFFLKGADCWGWATWKRGWDLFEPNGAKLLEMLVDRGLESEFNFDDTYPYVQALERQALGITKEWDIRWYASAFLAGKLTLYPAQSLVNNIGHDGSGMHCGESNEFEVPVAQSAMDVQAEVKHDFESYNAFVDFLKNKQPVRFNRNWASRVVRRVKRLFKGKSLI